MTEKKLKQKAIPLGVDYDVDQRHIIVNYELQITYGDKDGNVTRTEKKQQQKLIALNDFSRDQINSLADEIIQSCNLINPAHKPQLVRALDALSQGIKDDGDVSLDKLNKYIDSMYDDLGAKIQATGCVLTLCQQRQNLAYIAHNQVLLAALARVLREDGLSSIELGTNIAHIFYIISHFQDYGILLLDHKAPESLFKMVDQENTRYEAFYQKLSEMRQGVSANPQKVTKQAYQTEYEKFKRLIGTQDKLLFVALHTVINLTEVTELRQNKEELFLPMDKLCTLLTAVLARKPPNTQLVATVINYLKRISVLPGGIQCAVAAGVLKPLIKLLDATDGPDGDGIAGPVLQLVYNLAFDDAVRKELANAGVYTKLDTAFQALNDQILEEYASEYKETDSLSQKLAAVIKNHNNRQESEETQEAAKKAAQLCKLVTLLADDEHGMQGFAKTNIGSNLTAFLCLQKNQDPGVVQALHQLTLDPKIASKIAKHGLMEGLTDQFSRTKDKTYMQLFTGIAGAIPQDQRIGRQNAAKGTESSKSRKDGKPGAPPGAPGRHEAKQAEVTEKLYENAARLAEIALESGDPGLEKQALQLIAQAPGKHVDKEQAAKVTALAIQQLDKVGGKGKDNDIGAQIDAIGVISSMMSRASHVQQMCDNGELKRLPDQLLTVFKQAMGKTSMRLGDRGVDMQTCQFDLAIVCLVCILKACSYKVIRKDLLQRAEFLPLIVRMLYNIDRDPSDPVGQRHAEAKEVKELDTTSENASEQSAHSRRRHKSREAPAELQGTEQPKTLKPLLIQSHQQTVDKRVAHVLEALADLICDVLMFSEPNSVEQVKLLKFQRYNYDFYTKMLK